jgi:hypothetical protein
VLAAGQSICTAAATPVEMSVGQVITDVSAQGFCVHGGDGKRGVRVDPVLRFRESRARRRTSRCAGWVSFRCRCRRRIDPARRT